MGTRGHLGGLAEATLQALLILDAAGKDVIFVETVGTGQSEVEVIGIADTVLLVLMPGSGDSIQALKAGIMEIPDVIAINKKDHPAAKTMLNEVRSILALDHESAWKPPIVLTEADAGRGRRRSSGRRSRSIAPISRRTAASRSAAAATSRGEVFAVASARAKTHLETRRRGRSRSFSRLLDEVQQREFDPLTAVQEIMEKVFKLMATKTAPTLADIEAARARIAGKGVRVTPLYVSETFGAHDGPPGAAEGRDPPADGLLQDPRRRQQDRLAERRGAEGRRRRRERGQPRPGGRLGRARGRDRGDDLHARRDADGEGRADAQLRRAGRADGSDVRGRARRRRSRTSRRPAHVHPSLRGSGRDRRPGDDRPRARGAAARAGDGVVPIGGGGLASGIGLALRALRPEVQDRGRAGGRVRAARRRNEFGYTIAEGIAVKHPGELTSAILGDLLETVVTVTDEEISQAIVLLIERAKLVVEGAGAAARRCAPRGPRPGRRADGRDPLRRQHRSDAADPGHAPRPHARGPLPRRPHADRPIARAS